MRKIYLSIAAVLVTATACAVEAMAATPSITVKSDVNSVAYTYTSTDGTETIADAAKLFGDFSGVTNEVYTNQSFTITSESKAGEKVEVLLRIEAATNVLDYYDYKLSDKDGKVVYDSLNDTTVVDSVTSKDISLGIYNTTNESDTAVYTVSCKLNDKFVGTEKPEGYKISVVSQPVETAGETLEKPDYTVSVTAASEDSEAKPVVPTAKVQNAVEAENAVAIDGEKKTCGKDIDPGRYNVTGNGVVTIASSDGRIKSQKTVTDGKATDVEGVKTFVATLTNGDVVTASPLPGQSKPSIEFTEIVMETQAKATTDPKATAKPGATATPKASTTAKATATAKANPKTGDDNRMGTAVLVGVMAACAAAVGVLEFIKRRKISK